jgi:hypothetical protein
VAHSDKPSHWLWDQYHIVLDEYRFQVDLNWRRSQYFFVLNAAILAAGIGLLASNTNLPDAVRALPFVVGLAVDILAIAANQRQKSYYEVTAATKNRIEDELDLGDFGIRPTPELGGPGLRRLARVTTFQIVVLVVLAFANVGGVVAAFTVKHQESSTLTRLTCVSVPTSGRPVTQFNCVAG